MRANAVILKSPDEIDAMREAGRLSAKVLRILGEHAKPGVSTLELDELAEETIRSEGGIPAFKGYGGFPGSICASINDQIIHGIPSTKAILRDGDILSIDTGARISFRSTRAPRLTDGLAITRGPSQSARSVKKRRNCCA